MAPVEAQTTFVSNTGETVSPSSNGNFQAQDFTTGANTTGNTGFTLSEVQVSISSVPAGTSTSVTIRENNASNQPGDLVATLTNPATLTTTSTLLPRRPTPPSMPPRPTGSP